ncbi:AsmA family protein [Rhizomicrobium electricum]|uniref:AsmA domain-containing protein n=1 Tax=Rhizomicrobium electricum TaxID=480070 RepID=A0ABN1EAQ6_9PROT|nr:AsmA family protein [Rhizomicrobium electricum]NIJ48081.1 AsmA protein [Rhizomicrobium electricum]
MNKILRNSLIGVGAVAILVVAAPFIIPVDTYRGRIESAAAEATGRAFKIDGPLRVTLFPLGVRAKEVTLANVPGGRASVMVSVGDIDLSVKVLPLLTGRIALDKIVLDKPTIALEVDRAGNPNWKFGKESAGSKKKKGTLTLPSGTELSGIEVSDGRVTYDNAKTNTHRALEHVNVTVGITTADKPVTADGDMTYAGRKLTFSAYLATLQTFLGSGTTHFDIKADADLMHAAVKGIMTPDGTTTGDIKLETSNFRDLAAWYGTKLPVGGLGKLALAARIENKDKVTTFDGLKIVLDGQTMSGRLAVDSRATVPVLDGALTVDHLDLNPYLFGGRHEPSAPKENGWSKKPISVALIKEFNGRLALTTGALRVQGLHLGRTVLRIETQDGLLQTFLDQIALYGGGGKAELTIDARGTVPRFANTLQFSGVQLKPFLTDALGLSTIVGTGALNLDIAMAGASPNAILHSLSGKGAIRGANGRFKGVDLGAVARSVQTALGGATSDAASTSFHDMGASFSIGNGVMTTRDFHVAGPVVQMNGQGAIDVGNRTIAMRVRPEAGLGGYAIGVPFLITGSWDKLHYGPDVAGIVGGMMDSLKNGGSALGGLLGEGRDKNQQSGKKNVGDQLKDMFGIH